MRTVWEEWTSPQFDGSWAYRVTMGKGWRTLFRIDVSGVGMNSPVGESDLRIRYKNVAQVTLADETVVRNLLRGAYSVQSEKNQYLIIRLRTTAEAEKLVHQLKEWVSSSKPQLGVPQGISNVDLH